MTTIAPPAPPAAEQTRRMTLDEFERYIALPENADRHLEWHEGEMFEMVASRNGDNAASVLVGLLDAYLEEHPLGLALGSQSGFIVNNARYMADGAFITNERLRTAAVIKGYTDAAPEIAIEAISPTDKPRHLVRKLHNYETAGTVVWLIDTIDMTIDVYIPGQQPETLGLDDILDGGTILPGFMAPVKRVFSKVLRLAALTSTADSDGPTAP